VQWSDQPIYTLEKHHLPIRELAVVNAKDILLVQPEGPYVLGGHSYGGIVALEIAMVLEDWGHRVDAVVVMDTPLKEQSLVVPNREAKVASDEDLNDMMEMLIGALGSETVGLGMPNQHPRDSEEWRRMTVRYNTSSNLNNNYCDVVHCARKITMLTALCPPRRLFELTNLYSFFCQQLRERLEFMTPLWSVMSGRELTLTECRQGLEYSALTMRTAARPEDFRHHDFRNSHIKGKIVYLRAATVGSLPAIDDSHRPPTCHGSRW
jgi:hypothetical protein